MPKEAKELPRGVRNNNPGNIRKTGKAQFQGLAEHQKDKSFWTFLAPEWGIRAIAVTLITYQDKRRARDGSKIDTIREVIDRWAPSIENDTEAYTGRVSKLTHIGADAEIDVHEYATMKPLVVAIIDHENAGYRYADALVDRGLVLAGIKPPEKSLQKSKTIRGTQVAGAGTAGTAVLSALQPHIETARDSLTTLAPYLEIAKWALLLITLGSIGWIAWTRIQEKRRLVRP